MRRGKENTAAKRPGVGEVSGFGVGFEIGVTPRDG
jgi:hypothetical protein